MGLRHRQITASAAAMVKADNKSGTRFYYAPRPAFKASRLGCPWCKGKDKTCMACHGSNLMTTKKRRFYFATLKAAKKNIVAHLKKGTK